jgi:D-alanine-D-alanine ligase
LLAGGWSAEREVSLRSGRAVYQALDKDKYLVTTYDPKDDLMALMAAKETIDLAFILLHGRLGEDGSLQGFLDVLGIPFVGSGVLASAMAMNKKVSKEVYVRAGLTVPADVIVHRDHPVPPAQIMEELGVSTVTKPIAEGSSLGMSVCDSEQELAAGLEKAFRHDDEVMIEAYVPGREVTCCVMGNEALETLPPIEIVPQARYRFFDYEAKYKAGAANEICPARISQRLTRMVQHTAQEAHRALQCRVWSRTDMIIRDQRIYVLETNTIPGMTENSLFPLAARTAGMDLGALVDKLIAFSLKLANPR